MRRSLVATIWSLFDRVWSQIVGFFIGIVLARLLSPQDYGLVGISMIFIAFSNVFIEAGFSNALIRKLDRNQTDYSTAFHFNAVMGVTMYIILFVAAPFVAGYFEDDTLIPLTRIVSITIILNSLCIVQNAILTAEFKMKEQAIINISAQIPSGVVAMYFAFRGFGVYSLAIQTVLSSTIRTIMFWVRAKWRPSMKFSRNSMRYLWGFGSKLIGANLIGTFFNEIYTILIGKYISKTDLGYYSKGRSLSVQSENICSGVVQKVAIPILSQYQNDMIQLKEKYRELTMIINCIMTLISGIMIAIASPLVAMIWGYKWADTVPVLQLLIIGNVVSYVSYLSLVLLQIINHTEYTLKLEFVKKPVCLLVILFSLKYGMYGLLCSLIFNSFFCSLINISAPWKYINYTYLEQGRDVAKYVIALMISLGIVFILTKLYETNNVIDIIIRLIIVTLVYIGVLWIMKDYVFRHYGNAILALISNFYTNIKING